MTGAPFYFDSFIYSIGNLITQVLSLQIHIVHLSVNCLRLRLLLAWQVATFIVQKILLDDVGLEYICTTAERFFAVGRVLGNMVGALAESPSTRLLKHIIRCYLRLSDNPRFVGCIRRLNMCTNYILPISLSYRACDALRSCLPDMLRDATFSSCLRVSANESYLDKAILS